MNMRKELITDATLVSNYIKGDESALGILITRHNNVFKVLSILKYMIEILLKMFFKTLSLRLLKL